MQQPPRLSDVAKAAGVSAAIASRVLNSDPNVRVRSETRERIKSIASSMGYVPHTVARSLRGSRTGAIGVVMHRLKSPTNVDVLQGAQSYCAHTGYVTLLAEADDLAADDSQLRTFVARGRLDGVILHSGYGLEDHLVEAISSSVPAVLVNADGSGRLPTVRLDDVAAGRLAADHVLDLGHRHVTFIAGPEGSQSSQRREEGYRAALAARGLSRSADVVRGTWTPESGAEAVARILARPNRPTALVVVNDMVTVGVLSALRDSPLEVPADISVITVQESWFAAHLPVALTTISLPLQVLGATAARVLIDLVNGQVPVLDTFIADPAPQLVLRSSTGPPPPDS